MPSLHGDVAVQDGNIAESGKFSASPYRSCGRGWNRPDDARCKTVLRHVRLEKRHQGCGDCLRGFFHDEVTAVEGKAFDCICPLSPDGERFVGGRAPTRCAVGAVVSEIDAEAGAVILTGGANDRGFAKTTEV
jgi:hypothetical protein